MDEKRFKLKQQMGESERLRRERIAREKGLPPGDWRVEVPPDVVKRMNALARLLSASMPPGWGFGLFMFSYGEKGQMCWLSSAKREDMLAMLSEFIAKQGD